jgi:hypothetical protein
LVPLTLQVSIGTVVYTPFCNETITPEWPWWSWLTARAP